VDKKSAIKTGESKLGKTPKTKSGLAKPTIDQAAKPGITKPTIRKPRKKKVTIKSATAPAGVILPPSWKPKRTKTSTTKRIVRPTKPKTEDS
jgi:hypothetical protein